MLKDIVDIAFSKPKEEKFPQMGSSGKLGLWKIFTHEIMRF